MAKTDVQANRLFGSTAEMCNTERLDSHSISVPWRRLLKQRIWTHHTKPRGRNLAKWSWGFSFLMDR